VTEPPFRYRPAVGRPRLELPGGARVAVWIGLNIEHYPFGCPALSIGPATAGLPVDPMNYGWRDYGVRVGVWRVMDVLDRLGFRASVLLNSEVCERCPQIVEAGRERGWAWLAHGRDNATLQTGMSRDEERAYLRDVVETIERGTGQRPRGWLGPALTETEHTPALLAELGLTYVCDWCNDDEPYPLEVEGMISVPYAIEANDIPLLIDKGLTGPEFAQVLIDQFDVLYAEGERSGRVMAIPLHPFLVGQPFRIGYLERALAHIAGHEDVWLATSDEIAEWYLGRDGGGEDGGASGARD
jgi:peptidoglycan/xylan/chitin deacetylase (PgdA/CDA1 family)